jgi:hypothetical protein
MTNILSTDTDYLFYGQVFPHGRSALECGGPDAALAFARESQSGVVATALQNAPCQSGFVSSCLRVDAAEGILAPAGFE